jgi:tetratricopeptide (TPR) repeat protein
LSAETLGGLVLAGAASLLLAGILNQHLVGMGIAAGLIGIGAFQSVTFLRSGATRPNPLEVGLLVGGPLCGLAAVILRDGPDVVATALAALAALPYGAATRSVLRKPYRAVLATASLVPIAAQALVYGTNPAFGPTTSWTIGIAASMPWPAALAATEILRRRSAAVLRRQLVRAERTVQRKDYERSLAEYDRAIAAAPADVPGAEVPWYGKGATLVLLGRYEEAIRAIDTALDINPRNEVAWVNKGNALTRLGRLIDALRCFNAAIKVNPEFEVAWNNKGNALARLGKFEDALRCYHRALEIDPGYRGAWVNMGFVLTKMGRFDEAASCADEALRLDRGHAAQAA